MKPAFYEKLHLKNGPTDTSTETHANRKSFNFYEVTKKPLTKISLQSSLQKKIVNLNI